MFAFGSRYTEGIVVIHLNSALTHHAFQNVFEAGIKNNFLLSLFELLVQITKLLLHGAVILLFLGFESFVFKYLDLGPSLSRTLLKEMACSAICITNMSTCHVTSFDCRI